MDHAQALRHFQAFNRTRLERLKAMAPSKQVPFYDLLPLLFHLNTKVLPGYITDDTPIGIIDYQPDQQTLNTAQKYQNSFTYRRRALKRYTIRGLYLLNHHGLLHYPQQPKFDIWLVHTANLAPEQRSLLEQKTAAITDWALSLGISVTFKLLSVDFDRQSLSATVLDQFYLNGLVMAGSLPLWWLISPQQEASYTDEANRLLSQQTFHQISVIDFGPLTNNTDASELFCAAYQIAVQALPGRTQQLIDLLFYQQALLQFPTLPWLAMTLKKQLFSEQSEPLNSDISLLKFKAVIEDDPPISDLLQQTFYTLAGERLSQTVNKPPFPWRRDFMRQLVKSWGWAATQIQHADQQDTDFRQQLKSFSVIKPILHSFCASLSDFAQQQQLEVSTQLKHIERLRHIHLHPAEGIISLLPPDQRPASPQQQLYLYRFAPHQDWYLSDVELKSPAQAPLQQENSLLKLLYWAIGNQLLTRTSWLKVADHTEQITAGTVLELVQQLLKTMLIDNQAEYETAIASQPAAVARQVLIFANLEKQPQDKLGQQGFKMFSRQDDPLNFTSTKTSQVVTIEMLTQSSWGQWHYVYHQGDRSPLDMLQTLLSSKPSDLPENQLQSWCPTPIYGQAISQRLRRLCAEVLAHYNHNPLAGHYQIVIANHHYRLQWQAGKISIKSLPTNIDLG